MNKSFRIKSWKNKWSCVIFYLLNSSCTMQTLKFVKVKSFQFDLRIFFKLFKDHLKWKQWLPWFPLNEHLSDIFHWFSKVLQTGPSHSYTSPVMLAMLFVEPAHAQSTLIMFRGKFGGNMELRVRVQFYEAVIYLVFTATLIGNKYFLFNLQRKPQWRTKL